MNIHETINALLGGVSTLSREERRALLARLDSLGDSLRTHMRAESREMDLSEDEMSRALGVTHGIEFGAQIFHSEDTAGVLGFITGMLMVAAQAVFGDDGARAGLQRAMGPENKASGDDMVEKVGYSGPLGETLIGLSQLTSNATFLSLVLTGDAQQPTAPSGFTVVAVLENEDGDGRPTSEVSPEIREMMLREMGESRMKFSEEARASMEEKGLTPEQMMAMLKKVMTN